MTNELIARYQTGGDIYASLQTLYGTPAANTIAAAATTGDETQINAAIVTAKYGGSLDDSTLSNLWNQLTTDPLAAPLASANSVIGNTFFSFLKNPWVLVTLTAAGVVAFLFLRRK